MTLDYIQLAAHQLGMYLAMREIDTSKGIADWRKHNQAAAALRERVGATFQPYSYANKPLVKAAYESLQDKLITRTEFAALLSNVRGEYL